MTSTFDGLSDPRRTGCRHEGRVVDFCAESIA
jgi:hypothetical protein